MGLGDAVIVGQCVIMNANSIPSLSLLCRITVALGAVQSVGPIALGTRRISLILGGTVTGSLEGIILPGGSDWQLLRGDGVAEIDARYAVELAGGDLVAVHCSGYRHGPAEIMEALGRGEEIAAEHYYFSCVLSFEGNAVSLAGLDRSVVIANGARSGSSVTLDAFTVGR